MDAIPMRTCTVCKRELPITEFHKQKRGPGGYRCACKECTNTANRASYYQNRAARLQHQREYRTEHPEIHRATNKLWRDNHKLEMRVYASDYRDKNRERVRRLTREHRRNNPDKARAYRLNRQAKAPLGHHGFSADDIRRQYKAQKERCYWCACTLDGKFEVDHVIPLSRGGLHDLSNIVLACQRCNRRRHNKLPHEWPEGGKLL